MKTLTEVSRETYGHDGRAINRHSERMYKDENGKRYVLSRTLDGSPPFFEAYGPFKEDHVGALPHLRVRGEEYWGDGWTWSRAIKAFCVESGAELKGAIACSNAKDASGSTKTRNVSP